MAVGTLLMMVGLAYGLGVLWYSVLPASVPAKVWRVAAYPFVGIYIAEAFLEKGVSWDPVLGGVHLEAAVFGSIIAVVVDWLITEVRNPARTAKPLPSSSSQ